MENYKIELDRDTLEKQSESRAMEHSLKAVRDIIPAEFYKISPFKVSYFLVGDLFLYSLFIYLLAQTDKVMLLIPLWVLSGLSLSGLFIIAHDASHGALLKSKKLSNLIGQLLMLPTFHAYSAWDLGHNRVHHSFTTKEQKDFVWHPYTLEEYRQLNLVQRLIHKLEWSIAGLGLYYMLEVWWKKMVAYRPPPKFARVIARDNRCVLYFALLTLALCILISTYFGYSMLYGFWGWLKLVLVPWTVFNYVIGATVHIHHIQPEIAWHGGPRWTKFKGQMEATTDLLVMRPLNIFFHNIFVHVPHHVDPRIPFYNLPKAAAAIKAHYPKVVKEEKLTFAKVFRATRLCKIYDFDREIWLNYKGKPVLR